MAHAGVGQAGVGCPAHLGQVQKSHDTEAVVDRDRHHIAAPGKILSVIGLQFLARARGESAAMEPYHYRTFPAILNPRRPSVNTQAIFALYPVVPFEQERILVIAPTGPRPRRTDLRS